MTQNIIITGFGGQGILFAGKVLAYAAMLAGKQLSWLPSYGPEMRGGTANCHVIISDEAIGSPIVTEPDILITMNKPSLDKFEDTVKAGGSIVIDSSLIDRDVKRTDIHVRYIEATKMAMELGNSALANMVMLGSVIRQTGIFVIDEIKAGMQKAVPKSKSEMFEMNMNAVMAGYNA
jgi:2-oxoglutarate ferredoxin oxidoreductase subunit gamma